VLLIAGPTASGKSALALRLAERLGGEIVNADALQIYRDLRILTARPSAEDEARAPHHLFGAVDAAEGWSVGRWLRAAVDTLGQIAARGRPAIVVGGTGLYMKALTEGLSDIPAIPAEARRDVEALFNRLGELDFRAALAAVDPAAAERIAPGDHQRLRRALEVHAASGRSLSDWQAQGAPAPLAADAWRAAVLAPERQALYQRCDARLSAMVGRGALDEVRALIERGLPPHLPAMKAVGVRQFGSVLSGQSRLEAAVASAQQETRRYAKRQMTWLRNQTPEWPRLTTEAQIEGFIAEDRTG
jgi:tRNA dimethylallyltransferase